jgi:tryptophan 2,3-dioxygenase
LRKKIQKLWLKIIKEELKFVFFIYAKNTLTASLSALKQIINKRVVNTINPQ